MPGKRHPEQSKKSDEKSDELSDGGDGGTGSSTGHSVKEVDVLWARIRFLTVAFCSVVFPSIVGCVVYRVTNSFTIEVDFISALCDGFSILVNIFVEFLKSRIRKEKHILTADFVGGFISLSLLIGVAIFGVVGATQRAQAPHSMGNKVGHLGLMLAYNIFSITMDVFALSFWWATKDVMHPPSSAQKDRLNVWSGLVHAMVDFMRGMSVTCTTLWMMYVTNKGESPWEEIADKVQGDVFGSFLLCACVLLSAAFLLRESLIILFKIWQKMDTEEEEEEDDKKAQEPLLEDHDPKSLSEKLKDPNKGASAAQPYGTLGGV